MPGLPGVPRSRRVRRDPYDVLTWALLGGLAVVALVVFDDYAISNDEEVQQRYGELILAYYASGFSDRTLFGFKNLYLYGGLFDIVAALLGRVLPFDLYAMRHLLSALIGVGGIAATAATARAIAGPRAGFLAAAALAACGVWFGGMFNHTKDVPFAAAMIGATFFLVRSAGDLPRPRPVDVAGFGLMLGAALGLRAMGLLLPAYLGLVILWRALACEASWRGRADFVGRSALRFLPALVLGYAIMIAAWPFAALAPLNPVRALWTFAHFHYEIRTLLAGQVYLMDAVPRWYVPAYLAIKVPLLVHAGALLALAAAIRPRPAGTLGPRRELVGLIAFLALFPVAAAAALHAPAFTGMRHFLFVVPALAVLAGIGFDRLLAATERVGPAAATATLAGLAALFLWNAQQLVRLHPHQYLFYNALVGGLEGASRRYEMDYWVNMIPEAVKGLAGPVGATGARHTVGVCGERISFEHAARGRFQWTPGWLEADFFIAPTHMNCDRVLRGPIVFTIAREGVVIGVVQDLRGLPPHARGFADFPPGAAVKP